jgi:trigger factor
MPENENVGPETPENQPPASQPGGEDASPAAAPQRGGATAVAAAEGDEELPYTVQIEDAGPSARKISIAIPGDYVAGKMAEQFQELRQEANIPGFRRGHVPKSLIERRFAKDVRDQVKRLLIQETYEKAIEKHGLQILGEPDFGDLAKVEIKEKEPLAFSFTVELQPEIVLPELTGIKVRRPRIRVTEEHVAQALRNLCEQQGTLVPVTGRGVESRDVLIADLKIKVGGAVLGHTSAARVDARPARLGGVMIDDLDKQLAGMVPGDTREIKVAVPDDYPTETLRGKEMVLEITLKDLKRTEPAVVDAQLLDQLGFADEQELRQALREQMEEHIGQDIQNALRRQVTDWLLERVRVDLPPRLAVKQTGRVAARRAVQLLERGVPRERIEANMARLTEEAAQQADRELKVYFILQKLAEIRGISVSEAELNGRVAAIAVGLGERPEKVKQSLAKDSEMLTSLLIQMREEKVLDALLATAEVEEFDPTTEEQAALVAQRSEISQGAAAPPSPATAEGSRPAEPPQPA